MLIHKEVLAMLVAHTCFRSVGVVIHYKEMPETEDELLAHMVILDSVSSSPASPSAI